MTARQKLEQALKEISAYVNEEAEKRPPQPKKTQPEPNLDKIIALATKLNISYGRAMGLYHGGYIDLDGNKLR